MAISPFSTLSTGIGALSAILVTPNVSAGYQPQTTPKAPTILFHYEGEQTVSISSDITDHYSEANVALQDQISLKPEIITTHGFIGELNDVVPEILVPLQKAASKLSVVGGYLPALSTTALLAYNEAFFAYETANQALGSVVSSLTDIDSILGTGIIPPNQTQQQIYFNLFYGYWQQRTLFTVQTPWRIFNNMAIQSLRAIQDEETTMITDFEVSFKTIRFASLASSNGVLGANTNVQGRLFEQSAPLVNNGAAAPKGTNVSLNSILTSIV